jgi:phosphoribosylamine--glycine ligase
VLPLAAAQDHKRAGDGDTGPNTGGMGAYSPAPVVTPALAEDILGRILRPTVAAMAAAGAPFRGVLYAGLMITADGPKVLEFNVRFGDPECQALVPRLMSDLLPALLATRDRELRHVHLRWWDKAAVCVVMATRGYPGAYAKGSVIRGLEAAGSVPDVTIFHAGTARRDGTITAEGGRVLGVTALGPTIRAAQAAAYRAVDAIEWPEGFCRRDIGWRAIGTT